MKVNEDKFLAGTITYQQYINTQKDNMEQCKQELFDIVHTKIDV